MESTAFFEKKISLSPKDLNKLKTTNIEELLLEKSKNLIEEKCSEQGFVLPGSIKLISRSMGYFEPARFTGDTVYYVKLEGKVIYPADGIRVIAEVHRKNKMGLYVIYKNAIRIQIPRDLHLGSEEYEDVKIGDQIEVELKRSKFQINDPYILASGVFIENKTNSTLSTINEEDESEDTTVEQEVYMKENSGEGEINVGQDEGEVEDQEEDEEGEQELDEEDE